jgi:2'-5' RNA ligase/GNAT superfamily N-acetyltransferase
MNTMARLRLGVALLLPPDVAAEVNGLRRAVGDSSLARIPPHVTLVPPVNVRGEKLGAALAVLRAAAAATPTAITLTLGPPGTFLPDNPVLYLVVDGELVPLHAVRNRVFKPPLERPLSWPFVPHVTLADEAPVDRIEAATAALANYAAVARVDRVHLLREVKGPGGRRWEPLADAAFGPPAIIGRGGLALELTASRMVDPEAAELLQGADLQSTAGPGREAAGLITGVAVPPAGGPERRLVITGRREGTVVGLAIACLTPDGGSVGVVVSPACRRQGIGGHLLAAVEAGVVREGWGCSRLLAIGPPGFYAARSSFSVPAGYSNRIEE